jgi:hypothetical protein
LRFRPRGGIQVRLPSPGEAAVQLDLLTDDDLLRSRVGDLARPLAGNVAPGAAGSALAADVRALYRDLRRVGLVHLRPPVYLGDEWFSPEGQVAIAVPFYLAHPRLCALEQRFMHEVEGGTSAWCRQLLRHEAGHAFEHAYGVSRTAAWRRVFGSPRRAYDPDAYRPDPSSTAFVRHLPGFYAQAHPDEDFAETFAVLLTPRLNWRRAYGTWPKALAKLELVASLIAEYGQRLPTVNDERAGAASDGAYSAARMRMTLARYYERRLAERERAESRVKKLTPAHPPAKRPTRATGAARTRLN